MEYFPREINLVTIDYLDDEDESLKLVILLNIEEKYYTSKCYHDAKKVIRINSKDRYENHIIKIRYKINKIIINDVDELREVCKLKIRVIQIKFSSDFDSFVNTDNLPREITHLTFGDFFNQPVDNLPKSITHLTFGIMFNQSVYNLPDSITKLTFGHKFNQPVDNLPKSITQLTFGYYFNQPVDNLSDSITQLTFGGEFNKNINNLPKGLIRLIFGFAFNKEINKLPKGLTYLAFGRKFNQPGYNNLPKGLTRLEVGDEFCQEIDLDDHINLISIGIPSTNHTKFFKNKQADCRFWEI